MKGFIPDLQKIHDQIGAYKDLDSVSDLNEHFNNYRRLVTAEHWESNQYRHRPEFQPIWSSLYPIHFSILTAREEKNVQKKKESYNEAVIKLKESIKAFINVLEKFAR